MAGLSSHQPTPQDPGESKTSGLYAQLGTNGPSRCPTWPLHPHLQHDVVHQKFSFSLKSLWLQKTSFSGDGAEGRRDAHETPAGRGGASLPGRGSRGRGSGRPAARAGSRVLVWRPAGPGDPRGHCRRVTRRDHAPGPATRGKGVPGCEEHGRRRGERAPSSPAETGVCPLPESRVGQRQPFSRTFPADGRPRGLQGPGRGGLGRPRAPGRGRAPARRA